MEKTKRRENSFFEKVFTALKLMDERIENWVNYLIEVLEEDYQL